MLVQNVLEDDTDVFVLQELFTMTYSEAQLDDYYHATLDLDM